ncbi:PGPGW domain-containing protein [Phycisphaerales bacterium AB-hyl4]|uniref:PGPGW domain-containing protein n=1 Tax=Natronomicrosphaera hydrolytica TaxID=3242702 RepID=A0ABV4U201_9BACT
MTTRTLKRVGIGIVGSAVVMLGLALLVLPGPGWLTIFAGFGILATEFVFARRMMDRTRHAAHRTARTMGVSERWCRKLRLVGGPSAEPMGGSMVSTPENAPPHGRAA